MTGVVTTPPFVVVVVDFAYGFPTCLSIRIDSVGDGCPYCPYCPYCAKAGWDKMVTNDRAVSAVRNVLFISR
jgi:hypothetical protein